SGTARSAYSQQLTYSGGPSGTPIWTVTSGSLTGSSISLSSSGLLSGTPTAAGTYVFSVSVTIGSTPSPSQSLTLTVLGVSPTITSSNQLTGEVGLPFMATLTAIGGAPPYTWSEIGSLPPGLSLSSS